MNLFHFIFLRLKTLVSIEFSFFVYYIWNSLVHIYVYIYIDVSSSSWSETNMVKHFESAFISIPFKFVKMQNIHSDEGIIWNSIVVHIINPKYIDCRRAILNNLLFIQYENCLQPPPSYLNWMISFFFFFLFQINNSVLRTQNFILWILGNSPSPLSTKKKKNSLIKYRLFETCIRL